MNETAAMRLLVDLGYDSVSFGRRLRLRGVVQPPKWSCLVTSIARVKAADDRRRVRTPDPLPDIHVTHADTREQALAAMVEQLQRAANQPMENETA